MTTNNKPILKPFALAAVDLSLICDRIDNEENIDDLIKMEFDSAVDDVTAAVDRRKFLLSELELKIKQAKEYKEQAAKAVKAFEKIKERVVETTKQVIEANPGIPFKDSLGKKVSVMKNPMPSLKVDEGWQESNYAKVVHKLELDKATLKQDLIDGKEVDFAKLEFGTQLRGMK